MFKWVSKLFRSDRELREIVEQINALEAEIKALSNEQLQEESLKLKAKIQGNPSTSSGIKEAIQGSASTSSATDNLIVPEQIRRTTLDEALPRAFALIRETAKRNLGQRHFDVQLIGGIILHQGKIAEMRTGEGKTLAATAPAYLNALSGKGVHIVTVNEYLAKRDAVWMGQIYHALGLSVACLIHEGALIYDPDYLGEKFQNPNSKIQIPISSRILDGVGTNSNDQNSKQPHKESALLDSERDTTGSYLIQNEFLRPISRREAYAADITYGTNHEFGFDYLRDNLVYSLDQQVQCRAAAADPADNTQTNAEIILRKSAFGQRHSAIESTSLNFAIIDEVDSILIDEARTPLIISAPDSASSDYYKTFARLVRTLEETTDYTKDEKHHAVEMTEEGINKVEKALNIKNLYAQENLRLTHYLVESLKAHALFKRDRDYVVKDGEIVLVDQFTGRMLLGRRYSGGLHQAIEAKEGLRVQNESRTYASISIQNYFRLYKKLSGMTGTAQTSAEEFHKVYGLEVATIQPNRPMIREDKPDLIYKNPEAKYAAIAADVKERSKKGQPILIGTVSIDKNEYLSKLLNQAGVRHEVLNAKNHEREGAIIAQAGKLGAVTVATNMAGRGVDIILGGNPPEILQAQKVKDLGGLHVIGTERHESRRIDNQLRGRAGRQGDTGSSQFYLSLGDDLMRVFGGDKIKGMMEWLKVPEDMPIESRAVSRAVSQAQARVEGLNFDARKHLLDYDDVLNKQRLAIYKKRQEILTSKQVTVTSKQEKEEEEAIPDSQLLITNYQPALQMLDFLWMSHLENMEALAESVRLRAYGQHDPLVEYRREGHILYQQMLADFDKWIEENRERLASSVQGNSEIKSEIQPNAKPYTLNPSQKVGRNDPCPCGAKKQDGNPIKYKHCHGKNV